MEVPRHWRTNPQRYLLAGSVCSNCDEPSFPPRDVCPDCGVKSDKYQVSRGWRVEKTITQNSNAVNSSARITGLGYNGGLQNPNARDVISHSQTLKNEALIGENEIPVNAHTETAVELKEQMIYSASLTAD
ncbi:MAG: hypothetical protein ACD_13C00248G0030 [uncultured bacterium]|uniref:ChsH2 rubredoxin-like zinc ribbon domain-containing protein n=1 Tax=Candidatus Woesebacteria bacterium GW2011_GWA1_40_43 TaxID=1618553 RepID=A0A0G0SIH6_9BACT|nr:MAG: hypothetical protein ACD_13C00248G0030 [uncultured bacterium]KKR52970.1 MAG: hypothetical protein UT88_C0016G0007 [Candidatus Woesebacteria bacterium GW2011_GWD2_40_19]KKR56587.1 MAG: hypothetical protein UT96_C0040G0021 [Candidatus Woesebacteria bacterium GW2011_GWC2_40_30]KKR62156.1 MAG: hypothetical protein UU02_C0048G0006 [Candidatus Woesebacteria bacterium GW2011_GWA1_40_43]HAU65264.1 hypothetical protein [Candidatus Woesebacteria bacterium]